MKKIKILILLFIVATISLNAQKKCKFDYSKMDPFTKKMEVISKFWVKEKGVACQVGFGYKDNSDMFMLGYTLGGEKNYTITVADSISIITDKGEIITLFPSNSVPPTPFVAGNSVATNYSIMCNTSKEQLKVLSESKITAIKYPYDNTYHSLTIDESKAEKLMKNASCVLELNQ